MKYQFLGIQIPDQEAEALRLLQKEVGNIARGYGYAGSVTHGRSPFHITLVPPGMRDLEILNHVVAKVVACQPSFQVTLSGIGNFSHHVVYSMCSGNVDSLDILRWTLRRELGMTQDADFTPHVSLLRKFSRESFETLRIAATEAYEKVGRPLSFNVSAVTVFGKNEDDEDWRPVSRHDFPESLMAA